MKPAGAKPFAPPARERLLEVFQKVTPPRGYRAVVFLEDKKIPGTCFLSGHENHFHVRLVASSYKCKKP